MLGSVGGGGGGACGRASTAGLSEAQRSQLLRDIAYQKQKWATLETPDMLDAWLSECTKMKKNLEKNREALLRLETLDGDTLGFKMSLDDAYSAFGACIAAGVAFNALSSCNRPGPEN